MDEQKLMSATKPPFDGVSVAAALSGMQDIGSPRSYGCGCFQTLNGGMRTSISRAKDYVYSITLKEYTPAP
jgi:hypothetical protein